MKVGAKELRGISSHVGDLAGLDNLDLDALALFIPEDVRPLTGVAGFVDWRACGAISRLLMRGFFRGESGEVVLAPTKGRIGPRRCFLFGLGPVAGCDDEVLFSACRLASKVTAQAGAVDLGFAVPSAPSAGELEACFLRNVKRLEDGPGVVLIPPAGL